jgi:phosphoglycolate phosphatase-like HAD superfamily hydrolase
MTHVTPTLRRVLTRTSPRHDLASRLLVRLDRRTGAGRDRRWERLADELLRRTPEVVSVDIFDTVLIRPVVGEDNLLWVVGARLVDDGAWRSSVEAFVHARREASAAHPAGDIADLYGHPALAEGGDPDHCRRLEIELEAAIATAVPGAADGLQRLRQAGIEIVFATDMHLPSDQLWSTLTGQGLAAGGDRLVVSCEVDASKSAGTLFELIRPGDRRWVHVGNHLWGDVAMAERARVPAVPITSAEATALEDLMACRTGSTGSAIAGAARHARLAVAPRNGLHDHLVTVGADLPGQCFTAFLLWVRDQCLASGVRDVAFLARDGELFLQMAQAMPEDHWEGLGLHYLHASRRGWTLAAAASVGVDHWLDIGTRDADSFIHHSRARQPFATLLDRIGLTPQDLNGHRDLAAVDPGDPLPGRLVGSWEDLLADPAVRALIASRALDQQHLVVEYLRREGLGRGPVALVDVGWRGQLAWLLSALLRDATGAEPVHLHFGGLDVVDGLDDVVDIRRFAFDDGAVPRPFADPISCVEAFTASGAAPALGFESSDGRTSLIFGDPVPGVANEARAILWRSAVETASRVPTRETLDRWRLTDHTLGAGVRAVLTRFWTQPTVDQARVGASLAFESDDAGAVVGPVAAPYRLVELLGRRDAIVPRHWREASLVLTPAPLRLATATYHSVRDRFGDRRLGPT